MVYVFVPLILVLVAVLAWAWWSARPDRHPAGSVSSFHRALAAMQPDDGEREEPLHQR